jgi:hypothetical protein
LLRQLLPGLLGLIPCSPRGLDSFVSAANLHVKGMRGGESQRDCLEASKGRRSRELRLRRALIRAAKCRTPRRSKALKTGSVHPHATHFGVLSGASAPSGVAQARRQESIERRETPRLTSVGKALEAVKKAYERMWHETGPHGTGGIKPLRG